MATEAIIATDRTALQPEVIEVPAPRGRATAPLSFLPREGQLWLLATLVMFSTGLFKGINLLVLLAYLLGGIWLLNRRILRLDLRRIRGKRIPAGPIFAGEPVDCSIELACTGKRPVRGMIFVDRGTTHHRQWLVLSVTPDAPLRIRWRETFAERGRYGLDALRAYSSFPFGLTVSGAALTGPEEWIILPRLGRAHVDQMKHWLARILRGDGRMRRRQLLPAAQEADIHGLRDFRPGDSPRWIHWRTSARRNQLLVREFEDSAQPHLVMVVEPWMPESPTATNRERLETLISLAGTIARDWCRDPTLRLTMIIAGDNPIVLENGAGTGFALHLLEVLAVENGRRKANALSWLQDAHRAVRVMPLLVLSSDVDSPLADAIAAEIGRPVARVDLNDLPTWYEAPQSPG